MVGKLIGGHIARALILGGVLVALVAGPLGGTASASEHSYSCSGYLRVDHSVWSLPTRWVVNTVPTGTNPPYDPCTHYRSKVTVTDWSGGGSCGSYPNCWYYHNNSETDSLWQAYWWNAYAADDSYCYLVRAGGQGKRTDIGETYYWILETFGAQSSCWSA